jgi:hypothetical protein
MKRKTAKTYEADHRGRTVRVTVPERHESVAYSGDVGDVLRDVLDSLSPHAVAAIAAYLHPVRTMDQEVVRQLRWFAELLTEVVGGEEQLNRLCEEAGL